MLEEAHVSLFTFTKFLMWKDLEDNESVLLSNPLVRHIAASSTSARPVNGQEFHPERIDAEVPAAELPCVVNADSTQMAAIASALSGRSFVPQGPPGTGKSQTITNLIAAALARGKVAPGPRWRPPVQDERQDGRHQPSRGGGAGRGAGEGAAPPRAP